MKNLEKIIGYNFKNIQYLENALTHSSYANEKKNGVLNNERLEFLGDSILSICISEYIYNTFSDLPEGEMTRIRASVVCEKSLYKVAINNKFGEFIKLGKGEEMSGGRERQSILADCTEAVIAAIYIDGGLENAKDFIIKNLKDDLIETKNNYITDYKTKLQEIIQKNPEEQVEYKVIKEEGPDHDKIFTIELILNNNHVASGVGKSKKEAEQKAARELLSLMGEI